MIYRYYHIWLILRIILLLLNIFITGTTFLMIGERDLFFLPLILVLVLVLQVIDFILYTNRSNREIARFINNLSHQDLSEKFEIKSLGPPFKNLYQSLNNVVTELEKIKLEKEAQFNYLQIILSRIKTGIISVRDDDEIMLVNDSAKELLGVEENSTWTHVRDKHASLTAEIDQIKGRANKLIEVDIDRGLKHLSVNVSPVVILGTKYRIITIQDIRSEIEQKEIESWHKLIQILRHEIRNSVTPIASMTETIIMLIEDQIGKAKKPSDLSEQDIEDVHSSIQTVHDRSERLYQFVEKYRSLTRIPPPQKDKIPVQGLLKNARELFHKELEDKGIQYIIGKMDDETVIDADPSLIEQVLINLVKNSIEALEGRKDGMISLSINETANHIVIKEEDNGPGIQLSDIQDIFLPFFTTKKDGMGIGLSLSRQIMNLHGGTLSVESVPGEKTAFSLVFNK
jgi:nitrogen fixation/metabolism regulation signal transduction histidine kinase